MFSQSGKSLGDISIYYPDYLISHMDDFDVFAENVEPLSLRKQKSSRCRVAILDILLSMKPEVLKAFEEEKQKKQETRLNMPGRFNWETLEFNGFENVYDESVVGEENDRNFVSGLNALFGHGSLSTPVKKTEEQDDNEQLKFVTAIPRIFVDFDTLNAVMSREDAKTDTPCTHPVALEVMDLPYTILLAPICEEMRTMALQVSGVEIEEGTDAMLLFLERHVIGTSTTGVKAVLKINYTTGDVTGGAVNQELGDNLGAFYRATVTLYEWLQHENRLAEYSALNPKTHGMLLETKSDVVTYRIVSGKQRPDLPCRDILNLQYLFANNPPTVSARPYADEIEAGFVREAMSLEEKIEAAENGDEDCMRELAELYLNGNEEVPQDPEKAFYWYRKLAETGDSNGMFNLGLYYAKGFGVDRDFVQAADWMKKAAEAGDEDAPAVEKQYRGMADNLQKAKDGDAKAQSELANGFMLLGNSLNQAGPGKDYEESVKWAKKAAEQGAADAYWPLALAYHHGRGVKADIDQAITYYEIGAELGNASCMHNLACEYMQGENLWQNKKKAFALLKKAAEMGNGLAMRDLGRCYQFGSGCTGNMELAHAWYKKALEVIDDPELRHKVEVFDMIKDSTSEMTEDYEGESDPYEDIPVEGTQYEGRLEHCENLHVGDKLEYRIVKDKYEAETFELFHNGNSIGFLPSWQMEKVITFLQKKKIILNITVTRCVPKSQRGARARKADVHVTLGIQDNRPQKLSSKKNSAEKEQSSINKITTAEKKPIIDLYNWSFLSDKRIHRDDWSIALPDGFQEIVSDSGRSFEAIPEGESPDNAHNCSIHILSGEKTESLIDSDSWFGNEYSRAAYASLVGTAMANQLRDQLGMQCTVEGIAFEDMAAYVIKLYSPISNNYQCSIFGEDSAWAFRLDMKKLTPKQDADLTKSVAAWLKSFRTNRKNSFIPEEHPISSTVVYNGLIHGQFEPFEKAVDAAVYEYKVAVAGPLNALRLKKELGVLNGSAKDEEKKILQSAQNILEFHYLCADQLIEKIAAHHLDQAIISMMLTKLESLNECAADVIIQSEKEILPESKAIADIRQKWRKNSEPQKTVFNQDAVLDTADEAAAAKESEQAEQSECCSEVQELAAQTLEPADQVEEEQTEITPEFTSVLSAVSSQEERSAAEEPTVEMQQKTKQETLTEAKAAEENEKRRKKARGILKILLPILAVCITLCVLYPNVLKPALDREMLYRQANTLMQDGVFDEAKSIYLTLENYRNAPEYALRADYLKAECFSEQGYYEAAIRLWQSISVYSDSASRAEQAEIKWKDADYQNAVSLIDQGKYEEAMQIFAELGEYRDSASKQQEAHLLLQQKIYAEAEQYLFAGEYEMADEYFRSLGEYEDAPARIAEVHYTHGMYLLQTGNYESAAEQLKEAGSYQDAEDQYQNAIYQFGCELLEKENYIQAIAQFKLCPDYSDASEKTLLAKYQYVCAHKEKLNNITKLYLEELIEVGYSGAQKLYDEVYAWTASIVSIGPDPFGNSVNRRVGRPGEVWCVLKVFGGAPGEKVDIYVLIHAADGQTFRQNFTGCKSGDEYWVQYYGLSSYSPSGNITFTVYQQNGKKLTSDSTYWG